MDSTRLAFTIVALAACALFVVGFATATVALNRLPNGKDLIKRLYFGHGWPREAPIRAAYTVATGLLLGLIAAIGFAYWWVTSPGGDAEQPEPPPMPRRQPLISP